MCHFSTNTRTPSCAQGISQHSCACTQELVVYVKASLVYFQLTMSWLVSPCPWPVPVLEHELFNFFLVASCVSLLCLASSIYRSITTDEKKINRSSAYLATHFFITHDAQLTYVALGFSLRIWRGLVGRASAADNGAVTAIAVMVGHHKAVLLGY